MAKSKRKMVKAPDGQTRRAILDLLKQQGPRDVGVMAEQLGVSAMAVRQHLAVLEKDRLVTFKREPRPLGKPAKAWRLTAAADRFFPNAHADLTVALIEATREAFGNEGIEKLVSMRVRRQIESYGKKMPKDATLAERARKLADMRSRDGYMAEVIPNNGSVLLVENHCPICIAASSCQELCSGELEVFRNVLGTDVEIERAEHIVGGDRRCAYKLSSK